MYNIDEIKNKIICGDCLEVLKKFPDNSIDTIITDPPYNLVSITKRFGKENSKPAQYGNDGSFSRLSKGFMGKEWDGTGIAFNKEVWEECFRVAKPGATLMAFGGTRTYHRLACAIEDAGWIIKDCIMWLYGSGFPKSLNISKQLDKKAGKKGEKYIREDFIKRSNKLPQRKSQVICGQKGIYNKPATPEAKQWEGYGTALKPAYEPIIMAMKPNDGSYAENALRWGVAGMWIDGGRVESKPRLTGTRKDGDEINATPSSYLGSGTRKLQTSYDERMAENRLGRFPANIIHDNSEEVRECFPDVKSGGSSKQSIRTSTDDSFLGTGFGGKGIQSDIAPSSGNASRFFKSIIYQAKASRSERNMGCEGLEEKIVNDGREKKIDNAFQRGATLRKNTHPTVKPLALMEYLCLLTKTPTGGIVLDPFVGSGTTCMAAKKIGRDFIGIEKEPDYVAIAEARIKSIPESLF